MAVEEISSFTVPLMYKLLIDRGYCSMRKNYFENESCNQRQEFHGLDSILT